MRSMKIKIAIPIVVCSYELVLLTPSERCDKTYIDSQIQQVKAARVRMVARVIFFRWTTKISAGRWWTKARRWYSSEGSRCGISAEGSRREHGKNDIRYVNQDGTDYLFRDVKPPTMT